MAMDNETLGMIFALGGGNGGGGGSLIPVPTAQDAGKMLIVGVVQGEAGYQLVAFDEPMKFKGTLGTGGTITTLPAASSAENEGFVYIVITDGTYAGQSAKAGDTFVSDGSSWVLVPSGDEPSVIDDSVTSTALTWSSDKISKEYKVKSFTYTGNGQNTNNIVFPEIPKVILSLAYTSSDDSDDALSQTNNIIWDVTKANIFFFKPQGAAGIETIRIYPTYDDNTKTMTITSSVSAGRCFNILNASYMVYYI